jgi:5'-nucleotidase
MAESRPLILVTNDDGINAPGILALTTAMSRLGEVWVVAPNSPQSGMGHAVTIGNILQMEEVSYPVEGVRAFATSGTPVDCVKLAIYETLHRKPDLLVSGINHGSNSSINVIYSGTMSAAVEGAVENIPSVGFSLLDHARDADFSAAQDVARRVALQVLAHGLPTGTCLNVNIPRLPLAQIAGIQVCRQAAGYWEDAFVERESPGGAKYYWMTGKFQTPDQGHDTDEWALAHGYVSIVPTQFDLTAHHAIAPLNTWNFE